LGSLIRRPKDFWSGIIFLFFGLAAVYLAPKDEMGTIEMGTVANMGPGYFPTVLGSLLALIGLVAVVRSLLLSGEAVPRFYLKELLLLLAAVLLFGFLVRGAGLIPAALVLVTLSAYAGPRFRLGPTLVLAIGLACFAVALFVKLLGLPMPVFGPWWLAPD